MTITCTKEQANTIYTALRLELERNYGKDSDVVSAIQSAIDAVQKSF